LPENSLIFLTNPKAPIWFHSVMTSMTDWPYLLQIKICLIS